MGVNRSRRVRNLGYQRDKFSSARIKSAKCEAKTLLDLVEEDVDRLRGCVICDSVTTWASSDGVVTGLPDTDLYEMGILYDTPAVEDVLPAVKNVPSTDQEVDWDIVSEVSEWDVVSLDDGFGDVDSWVERIRKT